MAKNSKPSAKARIGGQALIEGVMMLGPKKGCMAVRQPDKAIYTEEWDRKPRKWYNKTPFIRGCVNFVSQMADGYKYINRSGEISGMFDEEEEEKEKKKERKKQNSDSAQAKAAEAQALPGEATQAPEAASEAEITEQTEVTAKAAVKPEEREEKSESGAMTAIIGIIAGILGVGLAIALFMILPTLIFTGIQSLAGETDISAWRSLVEGILKIAIFIGYLWLTSLMKTMRRMYRYHGAEHKTIFCYENGDELTVENVRKYKRFHPRCGTSFIFLTLAISILVYTLLPINSELFMENFGVSQFVADMLRVCCKIIFLPVVVGISYELISIAGKHDNIITKIISAPGLGIQRLTTKEPDDEMIEIAIASAKPVLPENEEHGS